MVIYSEFSHETWWFSMLNYQRVRENLHRTPTRFSHEIWDCPVFFPLNEWIDMSFQYISKWSNVLDDWVVPPVSPRKPMETSICFYWCCQFCLVISLVNGRLTMVDSILVGKNWRLSRDDVCRWRDDSSHPPSEPLVWMVVDSSQCVLVSMCASSPLLMMFDFVRWHVSSLKDRFSMLYYKKDALRLHALLHVPCTSH